ncbi:hypothetical protein SCATT_07220 [Streptantibioticus cattleyicolor NRRL 8057 = DSM 46488]|uniref:Membrane associated protein n=2 Tax=Kitasatosporales TaxID=85011 RepID=F8JU78_STREN|nr:hypothetical protein SCATT_07220 [Streptantibioticus cattleyicolor NRRL 8057 = DSM 46488]MYS57824.1 DUF881 domain-containing protein [Streptomyces sp. SID5468]CCB73452.1 conserved protein of unknown function [Streptantibioticus cattleyicolor NRRL 8057 = DSM 46488]
MSLLTNIMEHSLDDGYAEVTARRGETGRARLPRTARGRIALAAGLALVAAVVTVGGAQAQFSAPTLAKERQELIGRIGAESHHADALQHDVDALRGQVGTQQRQALPGGNGDADLAALLAGATAVHGPGLRLVVDDAKEATGGQGGGPRESSGFSDTGRVRDRDMQRVVNGLWAAGAEAIAVNGQRLTSLSAIRAAGQAILVDNKPLAPPYTVLAVGDGRRLSTAFQDGADGRYLHELQQNYGIRASVSVQDDVRLPAAPSLVLRVASPAPGGAVPGAAATGKGNK